MAGKYEALGRQVGRLVDGKNADYGNSFERAARAIEVLGLNTLDATEHGLVQRIMDKLVRLGTSGGRTTESPWQDLAGYCLLGLEYESEKKRAQEKQTEATRTSGYHEQLHFSWWRDEP